MKVCFVDNSNGNTHGDMIVADKVFDMSNRVVLKNHRVVSPQIDTYEKIFSSGMWIPKLQPAHDKYWRQGSMSVGGMSVYGISSITREKTTFTNGTSIMGDVAYEIFIESERQKGICRYRKTRKDTYGGIRAIKKERYNNEDTRYDGGTVSSIGGTRIINKSPFMLLLEKGYSTVACGYADDIQVHSGYTLIKLSDGSPRDFAAYKERLSREDDKGTLVQYDEIHDELIITRIK